MSQCLIKFAVVKTIKVEAGNYGFYLVIWLWLVHSKLACSYIHIFHLGVITPAVWGCYGNQNYSWDAKVWLLTSGSLSAGAELMERQQDAQPVSHIKRWTGHLAMMFGYSGLDYQYGSIIILCGKQSLMESTAVFCHFLLIVLYRSCLVPSSPNQRNKTIYLFLFPLKFVWVSGDIMRPHATVLFLIPKNAQTDCSVAAENIWRTDAMKKQSEHDLTSSDSKRMPQEGNRY